MSSTGNLPKVLPYKVIKQLNSSFTGKLHSDHRTPLCAFSDDFINSKFWQPNLETIGGVTMSLKTVKLAPKKWRISQATILPSFMRFGKFFTSLRTMWEKKTPISGHRVVLITFFFFFFFPFFFFSYCRCSLHLQQSNLFDLFKYLNTSQFFFILFIGNLWGYCGVFIYRRYSYRWCGNHQWKL